MDKLASVFSAISGALAEQGIFVVHGSIDEDAKVPCILLDATSADEPWVTFVDVARALGAKFAVINVGKLEESELDDAVGSFEELSDSGDETHRAVRDQLRQCREMIGYVAIITASVFTGNPTLEFRFESVAHWYNCVYDTESAMGDEGSQDEDDSLSNDEIQALAEKLAASPQFIDSPNADSRMYVARRVLAPDLDRLSYQLDSVVKIAKCIVDLEIKPKRDQELRKQVQGLSAQKMSRAEIAEKLGVPKATVSRLIT